jgi:hypothetical protein
MKWLTVGLACLAGFVALHCAGTLHAVGVALLFVLLVAFRGIRELELMVACRRTQQGQPPGGLPGVPHPAYARSTRPRIWATLAQVRSPSP